MSGSGDFLSACERLSDDFRLTESIGQAGFDPVNDRDELTKSKRYNNTSPPSTTNEDSSYHRQFVFDKAGNWDWFTLGSDPNTPYVPNALNLYDSINDPNDPNTAAESFTYDKDQNLTEDGSFEYAYDAENRMIEGVLPVSVYDPV